MNKEWQVKWNNGEKGRFIYSLINKVNQNIKCIGKSRKEEVIFNRILLGNSNLNSTLKIIGKHPNGYVNTVMLKKQYLMYLLNVGSRGGSRISSLEGLSPHYCC